MVASEEPHPPVTIRIGTFTELGAFVRPLRERVFVVEQRVPAEIEVDGKDDACVHVVALVEGEAMATGRLAPDGKVGRVAVAQGLRGLGLGRVVMRALEDEARRRGIDRVWLHAQDSAIGFYDRLGYERRGEPFVEAGIPHVAMEKSLA